MLDDHQHSPEGFTCLSCGASLRADLPDQFYCEYCGSPLVAPRTQKQQEVAERTGADPPHWLGELASLSGQKDPPPTISSLPATGVPEGHSSSCVLKGIGGLILFVALGAVVGVVLFGLSTLYGSIFQSDRDQGAFAELGDTPEPPARVSTTDNLIVNGGFVGLEGWTVQPSQKCAHCWMEVQASNGEYPHYVAWERTGSGADGAALWARQRLSRDVRRCGKLVLAFDVQVDHHSLANSGWWSDSRGGSGEYPAKVVIAFMDSNGERIEWARGFLYRHDGSTKLVNFTLVPKGQWVHFEADLFASQNWVDEWGKPLPSPVTLTDVFVGGNGWDFAGALTNLRLSGCQ